MTVLTFDELKNKFGLSHYGVKGQKWGVRRGDSAGGYGLSTRQQKMLAKSQPTEATAVQKKPGTRVQATGGKNQPASDDAKRAAVSRQKARVSTTDSLSNQELSALVKRMQLEQNYANLVSQRTPQGPIARGHKFVKDLLGIGRTANEVHQFANSPTGRRMKKEFEAGRSRA